MKNVFLLLSLVTVLASCGKDNKVSTEQLYGSGTGASSGTNGLEVGNINGVNFEGNYDVVRMDSPECGASIRIERVCNGYRLLSNNTDAAQDFCNVNRGESKLVRPDRNPPNPDGSVVVTQSANQLKAVVRVNQRTYTNVLTLENNGILVQDSNFKTRNGHCVFQKR